VINAHGSLTYNIYAGICISTVVCLLIFSLLYEVSSAMCHVTLLTTWLGTLCWVQIHMYPGLMSLLFWDLAWC